MNLRLALVLLLLCAGGAQAANLQPPPGFAAAARSSDREPHACPQEAAPYTAALDFPSKFEGSDRARDDLNRQAQAEYQRRIAPISALERGISQQVDDYLRSANPQSLACALQLLDTWASANALLGPATTHTGMSMRKWALGSVAAAYLRLKFSASRPLREHAALVARVEPWLATLTQRVVQEWSNQPLEKTNNHAYWAAWSVMASAVALDRRDCFDWARAQLDTAIAQIDAQGYLHNELRRDTRALYYHNYALTPLAMLAAFTTANGAPPSPAQREALHRLSARVLAGVADPAAFEQRTGKRQVMKDFEQRSKFAWLEPYCWALDCAPAQRERLAALRPLKSYRLGGNLTEIFKAPRSADADVSHQEIPSWMPILALR